MSDAVQTRSLSEDIAFIRALALEGQSTRYRGEIGLAAGLIWGSASIYDWAVWSKLMPPIGGYGSVGWIWLVALAAFMAARLSRPA